ncbi:membrane integrity-associated transporter subunit PqiC [Alcaligenaceae bacterium CGII-47]|nr:membrane integrity-associated transporter subunit PqiC [Alcaligenaceae bacterium CGII-47]
MSIAVSRAKKVRRAGLLMTVLILSACSILPKPETLVIYQLPATPLSTQTDTVTSHALPWSLRVTTPYSSQVIDSQRVLVVPEGSQVSAYSGVRWSDPAPVLVRNRLASAFRANGQLSSVSIDHSGMDADFELGGDLVAFQAVYQNGFPIVRIHYDASLSQPGANRTVATHRFEATEPVQGKDAPEVIEAFGRAADRLAGAMVDWTLQHLKNAK